jgi:hypothetical protein
MISDAKTVTDFLKRRFRKTENNVRKLRELCNEILVGYEESMACGRELIRKTKALKFDLQGKKIISVFIR